ncbi:tautomerase family protein [Paenibacillus eucommiae]|uniref:4-oxalocrotonate tautomerase n=1 Tax=Paenibacillus eucommiae TaxID=1355755 RepID=A0ABS4J433_9BACL|nr:tautomerase family protein [Paenibacillus eucommiae]MBP1993851.1 4-oxalocrotonate tautomerase [Paenibacillus eucommiae]
MPYITIKLMEGRSRGRKERLAEQMTKTVCEVLEVDPSQVRIEFVELKEGSFAVAGQLTPRIKDEWEGSDDDR